MAFCSYLLAIIIINIYVHLNIIIFLNLNAYFLIIFKYEINFASRKETFLIFIGCIMVGSLIAPIVM